MPQLLSTNERISFDGSPGLLLPVSAAGCWGGMYLPVPDDDEFDVEILGAPYVLDDTMDFESPRTDYDRICAIEGVALTTVRVGSVDALVMYGDGDVWTYRAELSCVVSNPDPESLRRLDELARAQWTGFAVDERVAWTVDGDVFLCSSGCHGGMLDASFDEPFTRVSLAPATYVVEHATVGAANVYRLRLSP